MSKTGFLQKLFRKKEVRTEYVSVDDNLLRALNIKTDAETALNIPAVSACVDFICGKIAELPIKLFKDSLNGKTKEITDDNRVRLLNDVTGDLLDPYQMKAAVVRDYLLNGTGYIYPERYRNKTISLRYIDAGRVSVVKNSDPIFKIAKYIIGYKTFADGEIIRICRNSRDGVKGVGIIDEHSELLSAAYKEIVYERYLVETGGNKKGFLQTEKTVSPDVVKQIKSDWEKLYSGSGSGIVVLNNGLKFTESSNTSVEMQLNENKTKNNELICQIFGLSPKVVSGAATDDEYVTAIKTAVIPICAAFCAALNKELLLPSEREEYYFAFDMKQLLKGDILKRYQAYQIALQSRFMQPNEVRYEEDLEPYEYDFITLGLSDVLLDLKTKTIYTPNTNKTVKFGENNDAESVENSVNSGIIEERGWITKNGRRIYIGEDGGSFDGLRKEPKLYSNGGSSSEENNNKQRLQEMIKNGDVTLTINETYQNRHYRDTNEYKSYLAIGVEKSYFTVPQSELQSLLNKKATSGDIFLSTSGAIRERIDFGKVIGYDTLLRKETSWVTVFYSKRRTHLSPYVPMPKEE